jgi:hypothetical protein
MASFLLGLAGKPIVALVKGGSIMPEFMVAIDHITYYAVQAEDEVTAIDLVLEGQGLEISSETRDAYISEDAYSDTRPHAWPRTKERAMDEPLNVGESTTEERRVIALLRHGPQSLQGLAETLGLNPEQTQDVLQRLHRTVGIVPLFRYNTLRYGLAE